MIKRILTALILAGIAIPCMIFQGVPFQGLVLFFVALAIWETIDLFRKSWKPVSSILFIITMAISILFLPSNIAIPLMIIMASIVLIMDHNVRIDQIAIIIMNSMIFILSVENVRNYGNSPYGELYFVLFGCSLICDTGAYFIGSKFGKNKLCPRLSPKKSVEGAIGGWIFGCLFGLAMGCIFINLLHGQLTWNFIIVASLLVPLLSEIGDLYFSSIKRYLGIKDFGSIFPGHGGGLDRIDGLLFGLFSINLLFAIANLLG